mmetsp:Transcript_10427/g.15795  ORF Transcript_10427/g.15795 Transcript_10427/m.15795 type:complete len:379 (-) Transcript_10427:209-1345(-)
MTDEGNPWISRNPRRKRSAPKTKKEAVPAVPNTTTNVNPSPSTADSSDGNKNNSNGIPSSLNPFLGWTKLSACHVRRPRNNKRRRRFQNTNNNNNGDEPLLCVEGKAIFFLHDPRAAESNNKNEEGDNNDGDENKPWFQGRFFPSFGLSSNNNGGNNNTNGSRASPTSVVVSSDQQQLLSTTSPQSLTSSSWGLLAVQNSIQDECLLDDCGGYRELDLTIIRNKPNNQYRLSSSSSTTASNTNNNKLRWVIENVEWTGGDMMRLSTDPYSLSSLAAASLPMDENGVKFEPKTLMEGDKAMAIASKYFPSMVKRLQIHKLMNEEEEEGEESTFSSVSCDDIMVIIGDMSIVAPKSFVRPQSGAVAGTGDSDEDGLWNDE